MLRDEAIEALFAHLEKQSEGGLEITVDNGIYRAEITVGDGTEWAEHTILSDALSILVGLLNG